MDRDNDFSPQVFGHAQQVNRSHLVLDANRIVSVIIDSDIDIEILAVFSKVVREMGVCAMVNRAAWCFKDIIDSLAGHFFICHSQTSQFAVLRFCSFNWKSDQTGTVEGLNSCYLDVLKLKAFARFDDDDALFRHTPFFPNFAALVRADKFDMVQLRIVDNGCCSIDVNVVTVEMRYQIIVQFIDGKRVNDHRLHAQIRLQLANSGHIGHLVSADHVFDFLGRLAAVGPEVHDNIGAARRLDPDPAVAQPPHSKIAFRHDFFFNFFIKPGSPFWESA
ncbi:hypothetical protein STRDD11_01460 [Streptococcus sp. DD11]|nr:hypothetical protein STRDD11_01460 [Streptococcus sp. DD11]